MKTIVLLSIFLLISKSKVFSQFIVKENIQWSVASFGTEGNDVKTTHYKIEGDTLIDDKLYKYILAQDVLTTKWNKLSFALFEEDGIVSTRNINIERTNVLYNFSLKIGESFFDEIYIFPYTLDSIVTLEIQDIPLKHYFLSRESGEIQVWIEKYGSLKGLLHPAITTGAALKLLCFEENGELLYQNTEYNTCHLVKTDKKSLTTKPQFILLSSMDKGTVLIQNETDTHGQIRFFDANGKQIFHSPLNASNIQLCLPQSGLIFYRFETEGGEIQSGKIIVE